MYGDIAGAGDVVDVTLGCRKEVCEVPCKTCLAALLISDRNCLAHSLVTLSQVYERSNARGLVRIL
jgi:hypothetical protein